MRPQPTGSPGHSAQAFGRGGFTTRTILSANNYSDCKTLALTRAYRMCEKFGASYEVGGYAAFAEMLHKGYLRVASREQRIIARRRGNRPPFVPHVVDLTGVTPATWDERVYDPYSEDGPVQSARPYRERMDDPVYEVEILYQGWTYEDFRDEGLDVVWQDKVRARLRQMGFVMTPEDDAAYAEWRKEMQGEDEEDLDEEAEAHGG